MSVFAILLEVVLPTGFYIGMAVFTFGRVSAAVAYRNVGRYPSLYGAPDWGDGIFIGIINAPFWPLTLPVWVAAWYLRSHGGRSSGLFAPPPHLRAAVAKLERESYEACIRELEREAGIR